MDLDSSNSSSACPLLLINCPGVQQFRFSCKTGWTLCNCSSPWYSNCLTVLLPAILHPGVQQFSHPGVPQFRSSCKTGWTLSNCFLPLVFLPRCSTVQVLVLQGRLDSVYLLPSPGNPAQLFNSLDPVSEGTLVDHTGVLSFSSSDF